MVLLDTEINFYYSDSDGSLGGNISSVKIPTNQLGNLFSDLVGYKAIEGITSECRCIYIKNDSQTSKTAKITIWVESNAVSQVGNTYRVLFGLGAAGVNGAELVLPTPYMLPPFVQFVDISTKPTQPQILRLEPQQRIAVWFNFQVGSEAKAETNVKFTFSVEVARATEDLASPLPQCPAGQTYDPSTGLCVDLPDPECPDDTTYDPVTNRCIPDNEIPECPTGQHYNPTTGQCEDDVVNPPSGQIKDRIFGAVGDFSCSNAAQRTFQALRSNMVLQENNSQGLPLSVWLPLGDYSYDDGDQSCFLDLSATLEDVYSKKNSFPNIGNHDDEEDGEASDRQSIINAFGIPSEGYYSKTIDNVRIIVLDTQKSVSLSSPQVAFFKTELEKADADPLIKWIIVHYHKPSVTSTGNDHGQLVEAADGFHALIKKHKVDFVLAGHNHNSEVTYMITFNDNAIRTPVLSHAGVKQQSGLHVYENIPPASQGTIFMVLGGGGRAADTTDMDDPWMAYAQNNYATGFFQLKNNGNIMAFKLVDTTDMSVKYLMEVRK